MKRIKRLNIDEHSLILDCWRISTEYLRMLQDDAKVFTKADLFNDNDHKIQIRTIQFMLSLHVS